MHWNNIWRDHLITYVSAHPVPDMGPFTAEYVSNAGSDLVGIIRCTEQIPADPTGRMDDITPYVQGLINSQFLTLHRYLCQQLGGIPFFLTVNRVHVNYTPGTNHALQQETIIRINIQRTRVSQLDGSITYLTDPAHMAQALYAMGFHNNRQREFVFFSRFEFFAQNSQCRFSPFMHRFYSFFP